MLGATPGSRVDTSGIDSNSSRIIASNPAPMKQKLLTAVGALLLATGLSSCYVYDDPLSWRSPYHAPVYRSGFAPRPVIYPSRNIGYGGFRGNSCAPRPPSCGRGGFGGRGWR